MVLMDVFTLLAAGAAFVAAFYWYRSSRVAIPNYDLDPVGKYEPEFHQAIVGMAHFSQRAAIWAGIAAILGATSALTTVRILKDWVS